ncbi:MAG: FadR family transcriptional regulator [Pedobacter sp.]|nr:FadR family transcriptional regulator [Chitinophagaceae bacterium]
MASLDVLDTLNVIEFETPVDKIITQLKQLITSGQLKPGDRLPAERLLAEKFGVGRGYIREAIMKLEFYGLIKTSPQSGTYVSGFSLKIMDSIFSDIIKFNKEDFNSLAEGRFLLESSSAHLAAMRRTDYDILEMQQALAEFDRKVSVNEDGVDDDMIFHIRMASATKNSFIESMILILIPDLIRNIHERNICNAIDTSNIVQQHHDILDAIILQDADAAEAAMKNHLKSWGLVVDV